MTGSNSSAETHRCIRSEPPRRIDLDHRLETVSARVFTAPPTDVIAHLVIALSRYLRHLRADRKPIPPQLDDLSMFLASHVRQCQDVSPVDLRIARLDSSAVSSRLLLTKREAAEQLGVSLRTIERLISAGRLPLVHVEGAARVRVTDLETYVQGLEADDRNNPSPTE